MCHRQWDSPLDEAIDSHRRCGRVHRQGRSCLPRAHLHSKLIFISSEAIDRHRQRDGTARLWELASGKEIRDSAAFRWVSSVSLSADANGSLLEVQTSRPLVDVATGKELCRLVSFHDGSWAVIDPDGRFDTNNLDESRACTDDARRSVYSLARGIFMRDYYEPRLLARIWLVKNSRRSAPGRFEPRSAED